MNEQEVKEKVETSEIADIASAEEKTKKPLINAADIKEGADKTLEVIGNAAKDVGEFADAQFKNAKRIFGEASKNLEETLSKQRLEKYRPIFPDEFDHDSFDFPSMINVVEFDKRMKIEECKGAIGYRETVNNVDVLGIYKDDMDKFGISYYPDNAETAYYVHPLQEDVYIEINEYFKYLKDARVAELEYIAQSLGAKHFRVSIMEESSTEQIKKTKGSAKLLKGKDKGNAEVEAETNDRQYSFLGVAAENRYPGKAPVRPELKYWANNESIKSLVDQRMNSENPLLSRTYKLDYNTCTGIKEKEAAKIDGVLKALKFTGAGSVS